MEDLTKAHIKGYSRRDGVYVQPHDRDTGVAAAAAPVHHHPRTGEAGEQVEIKRPSHASLPSTWHNPDAVATFVPGGDVPASLNGVSLTAWKDHPRTSEGWDFCDGINEDLYEPPFHLPPGKKAAAGVVIEEPDGRCWVVHPTNAFGNYQVTWPKGTCEPGLSMQGNALKETYEEAGLKIEITGFIGDFERTTSKARMYRAKRIGGTPIAMGWESQAVSLCPRGLLYDMLNMYTDHPIAETIGAGPAPKKPAPSPKSSMHFGGLFGKE